MRLQPFARKKKKGDSVQMRLECILKRLVNYLLELQLAQQPLDIRICLGEYVELDLNMDRTTFLDKLKRCHHQVTRIRVYSLSDNIWGDLVELGMNGNHTGYAELDLLRKKNIRTIPILSKAIPRRWEPYDLEKPLGRFLPKELIQCIWEYQPVARFIY